MKYLPLVMVCGPVLAQLVRDAAQDLRRCRPCNSCGARMAIMPDRSEQMVRCPVCLRAQRVSEESEAPWRLNAASAEALRRTKSWPRWV